MSDDAPRLPPRLPPSTDDDPAFQQLELDMASPPRRARVALEPDWAPLETPRLLSLRAARRAIVLTRTIAFAWSAAVVWAAIKSREDALEGRADDGTVVDIGRLGVVVAAIIAVTGWLWSDRATRNVHRLDGRLPTRARCLTAWLTPLAWAGLLAVTVLRLEPGDLIDVRPMIVVPTLALALWRPYSLVRRVLSTLSRLRSDALIGTAYVLELAGFGLLWWQLATWPSPLTAGEIGSAEILIGIGSAATLGFGANIAAWALLLGDVDRAEAHRLLALRTRHDHRQLRLRGIDPMDPDVRWALLRIRQDEELERRSALQRAPAAAAVATPNRATVADDREGEVPQVEGRPPDEAAAPADVAPTVADDREGEFPRVEGRPPDEAASPTDSAPTVAEIITPEIGDRIIADLVSEISLSETGTERIIADLADEVAAEVNTSTAADAPTLTDALDNATTTGRGADEVTTPDALSPTASDTIDELVAEPTPTASPIADAADATVEEAAHASVGETTEATVATSAHSVDERDDPAIAEAPDAIVEQTAHASVDERDDAPMETADERVAETETESETETEPETSPRVDREVAARRSKRSRRASEIRVDVVPTEPADQPVSAEARAARLAQRLNPSAPATEGVAVSNRDPATAIPLRTAAVESDRGAAGADLPAALADRLAQRLDSDDTAERRLDRLAGRLSESGADRGPRSLIQRLEEYGITPHADAGGPAPVVAPTHATHESDHERWVPPRLYTLEAVRYLLLVSIAATAAASAWIVTRSVSVGSDLVNGDIPPADVDRIDLARRAVVAALGVTMALVALWCGVVATHARRAGAPLTRQTRCLVLFGVALVLNVTSFVVDGGTRGPLSLLCLVGSLAAAMASIVAVVPIVRFFERRARALAFWAAGLPFFLAVSWVGGLQRPVEATDALEALTFGAAVQAIVAGVVLVLAALSTADVEDALRLAGLAGSPTEMAGSARRAQAAPDRS